MTYDIHPIIVHFPIALLFLYSVIKILPFLRFFPRVPWRHIEVALLVFGVAGAFAALYTGGMAEQLVRPDRQLVEMHSLLATISTVIYGVLLLGEVLYFLNPWIILQIESSKTNEVILFVENILTNSIFSKILALIGLIAISVTGMLGGVMVYGLSADPLAPMVLRILGISY